jgi:hypothetical protein
MKIEIEIPEPPEGWVFDGARIITYGERYLFNGAWVLWESVPTTFPVLVCVKVKPLWEPSPELVAVLRPGWLTQDENARLTLHSKRPRQALHSWVSDGSQLVLWCVRGELLPPTKLPWDQCCFKIGEPQ